MTHFNTLNIDLPNLQLNELYSGIKNSAEVTLNLSSNVVGDSIDEINFQIELLSTDTQASRLCKVFRNKLSADVKLSKAQLSKITQSGRSPDFLDSWAKETKNKILTNSKKLKRWLFY